MENLDNSIIEIETFLKRIDALFFRISGKPGRMRFVRDEVAVATDKVGRPVAAKAFRILRISEDPYSLTYLAFGSWVQKHEEAETFDNFQMAKDNLTRLKFGTVNKDYLNIVDY